MGRIFDKQAAATLAVAVVLIFVLVVAKILVECSNEVAFSGQIGNSFCQNH